MKNELFHYGVKGQKWGIRRYQNEDGTLTEFGKKHYKTSGERLFVSGSSKTQDSESVYYRKKLPKDVRRELERSVKNKDTIIVGDAPGIDRQVQDFLVKYRNVVVYGPGEKVRYQANPKWKSRPIPAPEYEAGSKEWLAKKDIAMTNDSTRGLAIVLDEGSSATRRNIDRLIGQNKNVKVFELSRNGKKNDKWW